MTCRSGAGNNYRGRSHFFIVFIGKRIVCTFPEFLLAVLYRRFGLNRRARVGNRGNFADSQFGHGRSLRDGEIDLSLARVISGSGQRDRIAVRFNQHLRTSGSTFSNTNAVILFTGKLLAVPCHRRYGLLQFVVERNRQIIRLDIRVRDFLRRYREGFIDLPLIISLARNHNRGRLGRIFIRCVHIVLIGYGVILLLLQPFLVIVNPHRGFDRLTSINKPFISFIRFHICHPHILGDFQRLSVFILGNIFRGHRRVIRVIRIVRIDGFYILIQIVGRPQNLAVPLAVYM